MREVITYYAYDDTEFESREECEAYEGTAFDLLAELFNACRFFKNGQEILVFLNNVESGLDTFDKAYYTCDEIEMRGAVSEEARDFIYDMWCYELPSSESGLYRYDDEENEWVKVDE